MPPLPHEDKPLRVWWIPQIPGKQFYIPVGSLREARLLLDVLAAYDMFQLENHIKPDYANAGGLMFWDPTCPKNDGTENTGDWTDWDDPESGDNFDDWCKEHPEVYLGGQAVVGEELNKQNVHRMLRKHSRIRS